MKERVESKLHLSWCSRGRRDYNGIDKKRMEVSRRKIQQCSFGGIKYNNIIGHYLMSLAQLERWLLRSDGELVGRNIYIYIYVVVYLLHIDIIYFDSGYKYIEKKEKQILIPGVHHISWEKGKKNNYIC